MDTREVSMYSVYSGETMLWWQTTVDGRKERVPVPKQTAVQEWYMGGVDPSDQMLGTYSVHCKTRKWYMIIFQHFLDISVTNSFILHKELSAIHHDKHLTRNKLSGAASCSAHMCSPGWQPQREMRSSACSCE